LKTRQTIWTGNGDGEIDRNKNSAIKDWCGELRSRFAHQRLMRAGCFTLAGIRRRRLVVAPGRILGIDGLLPLRGIRAGEKRTRRKALSIRPDQGNQKHDACFS